MLPTKIFGLWYVSLLKCFVILFSPILKVLEFCETVNPNLDNFEVDGVCYIWQTSRGEGGGGNSHCL